MTKPTYAIFTASREGFNDSICATTDKEGKPLKTYEQAYKHLFTMPDPTKVYIDRMDKKVGWR